MLHYVDIGGRERPVCFSYSVAYQYEKQTGNFYEPDVQSLAIQVIAAGATLGTDDVATAARTISIVKFADIMFAAFVVGGRKAKTPVDFTIDDLVDWLGENPEAVGRLTELLLTANFKLPESGGDLESPPDSDAGKKKTPARSIGMNS